MQTYIANITVVVESNDIKYEDDLEWKLQDLLEQFNTSFKNTTLKVKTISAFER